MIISHTLRYDVDQNRLPLDTTRASSPKMAIMEKVGYWRGYDSAADFRKIKVRTWDDNANKTKAWLNNSARKGVDDIGRAYGPQLRGWVDHKGDTIDQLMTVYDKIKRGVDDRGLIMTYYNPGEFDLGSLRPCMHTHQFSILGDTLHLNSSQRSCDVALGLNFNQVQCFWMLKTMAMITGLKPGKADHTIVNAHIYEDQLHTVIQQLNNEPYDNHVKLILPHHSKYTMDYILDDNGFNHDDIIIENYTSHGRIQHAFSE